MRLIDADMLIKRWDEMSVRGRTEFDQEIMVAPRINIDRPQGKWIRDRYWSRGIGMGEEYGFFYKCSLCEYEVEDGYTRCGFNFCPYCGADMRKGVDDGNGYHIQRRGDKSNGTKV